MHAEQRTEWNRIATEWRDKTAYALRAYGDCFDPNSATSPGAEFLKGIRDDVVEAIDYRLTEDATETIDAETMDAETHETADAAVPVYTVDVWRVFTDLGAWTIDMEDIDTPGADMTDRARTALYVIARDVASGITNDIGEALTEGTFYGPADPRCPACGDPLDYCQGHGPIGDPAAMDVLAAHDRGEHGACHPAARCED